VEQIEEQPPKKPDDERAKPTRSFRRRPYPDDAATTPHEGNSRIPTEELNPDDFE
jgi:hypothetical protein